MPEPEPDDIDTRVSRLEREVAQLRERVADSTGDAAATRVLASGADRDVSEVRAELRAHVRALDALRETQLEMQVDMREMRTEMRDGFSVVDAGMAQISALLADSARDDEG